MGAKTGFYLKEIHQKKGDFSKMSMQATSKSLQKSCEAGRVSVYLLIIITEQQWEDIRTF